MPSVQCFVHYYRRVSWLDAYGEITGRIFRITCVRVRMRVRVRAYVRARAFVYIRVRILVKQWNFILQMILWISFPHFFYVRARHWRYGKYIWQSVILFVYVFKNYNSNCGYVNIDKIEKYIWLFSGYSMALVLWHLSGNSSLSSVFVLLLLLCPHNSIGQ